MQDRPDAFTASEEQRQHGLLAGFSLTLLIRLLSVTMLIVLPIFLRNTLKVSDSYLAMYILLIWIGNATGMLLAITTIKKHHVSSFFGFSSLSVALIGFALASTSSFSGSAVMGSLVAVAGIGMGLPQPFLAPLMHLNSKSERPFVGIGLYSIALAIGLILGPFTASIFFALGGFSLVFVALAGVAMIGACIVAARNFLSRKDHVLESRASSLSLSAWLRALRTRAFANAFLLNFLYSMILPIVISYAGVYGGDRFGISATNILFLFTATFVVSALIRVYVTSRVTKLRLLILPSLAFLIVSIVLIGTAPTLLLFTTGMMIFSIPHALIFPITNFYALKSVGEDLVMNASYLFQTSSGIAEFVSPSIAGIAVVLYGISNLFIIMSPIAFIALFWALASRFQDDTEIIKADV